MSLLGNRLGIPYLRRGGFGFLDSFDGASVGYSLRQLSTSSTDVVRVRRNSDNAESDFTANEVSNGTLQDWVNTDVTQYTSDFNTTIAEWTALRVTLAQETDPETGSGNVMKATVSADGSVAIILDTSAYEFITGEEYTVSADIYIPSTNSVVNGVWLTEGFNTTGLGVDGEALTPQDSWVTVSGTGNPDATQFRIQLDDSNDDGVSTITGGTGDVVYVKNVSITQNKASGYVPIWYDQRVPTSKERMYFDANDDEVVIGDISAFETNDFEVNFKFVADTAGNGTFRYLFSSQFQVSGSDEAGWALRLTASNQLQLLTAISNTFELTTTTETYTDGAEHTVSVVKSGTDVTITIDGTDITTDTLSSATIDYSSVSSIETAIGTANGTGFNHYGTIYDVVLKNGSGTTLGSWNGYGNIDEDWTDQTANGNDGTVNGSPNRTLMNLSVISKDATQTTAADQPLIVNNGTLVVTDEGKPAIEITTTDQEFDAYHDIQNISNAALYLVHDTDSTSGMLFNSEDLTPPAANNNYVGAWDDGSISETVTNGVGTPTHYVNGVIQSSPTRGSLHTAFTGATKQISVIDIDTSNALFADGYTIWRYRTESSTFAPIGKLSEFIIIDNSDSRDAIENNINNHYNIY